MLTRQGYLVKEQGMTYLADRDADNPLASLQAAACSYRIALGPRAGQKLLSLRAIPGRDKKATAALCADAHVFSLHAGMRCGAHQRKELERLCRYITYPVIVRKLTYPSVGDMLFYPGGYSETEFILAYGYCCFASKMGQLAGNHFLSITEGRENLRELGRKALWNGAQDIFFEAI